jgi:hypothetical protein
MERLCQKYYRALYTKRPEASISTGAKFQALRYLSDRLTGVMKVAPKAPFQLGELHATLTEMKVGKSPGPDGIIFEFYREFWQLIGEEYLKMI